MSWRTVRSRPWLSSWPVAAWKRRLNSSSLASPSFPAKSASSTARGAARGRPAVALQLARRGLEAQVEQLLLGLAQLLGQVVLVQGAQLGGGGHGHQNSPASRVTNLHFMGSLCLARRSGSDRQ